MCSLEKRGDIFILTITGDDDHRLNPTLIDSIRSALDQARSESARSSALITTAEGKFFSNGYDLAWAQSDPDSVRLKTMSKKLRLLVEDLISLPMPTIVAVSGHAVAAGFVLALCHDYILMREKSAHDPTISKIHFPMKIEGVMCSLERRGAVFILTITGDDEHRLTPTLIDSIRSALDQAKSESTHSSALITTAEGKFFSNGYDLSWAVSDPDPVRAEAWVRPKTMSKKLRLLVEDLISLPMPTIAAVTGHATAAGFILALSHDYILMRGDRGYLYLNEIENNLAIPNWFWKVLKSKIGTPKILKNVLLKAPKIDARTALEWSIVDSVHANAAETVDAAVELAIGLVNLKLDGDAYAANRRTILADVLGALDSDEMVGDYGCNVGQGANVVPRL